MNECLARYGEAGLVDIEPFDRPMPVNAGKTVGGVPVRSDDGQVFLTHQGEIFRKHGADYFRVIGAGDQVRGEVVTDAEFLGVRQDDPSRVFVDLRFESQPATSFHYELLLDGNPRALPPRLGAPTIHPESGDLYLPLSHLTAGRNYLLRRSDDLMQWEDVREVEVLPLQFLMIPAASLGVKGWFRVEER